MKRKRFYSHLYFWVLVAMVLGTGAGHWFPQLGVQLKPLGDGFIRLIRMVIAPLIFTTVVVGIAGMDSLKRVGRIGFKSFVCFEAMTTLALIIGWVVVEVFKPGTGMNADLSRLDASDLQATIKAVKTHPSTVEFLLNVIPETIVGAFAKGEILQVLFFSVVFGIAIAGVGEANRPVINGLDQICQALMRMIAMIIKAAPVAVFGAMSFTVAKFGLTSLISLGKMMACLYGTCIIFVLLCLGLALRLCGIGVWKFLRYLEDELFIVFGTASSEPALPGLMAKLEQMGCPRALVGIVVPAGYTFNLVGTSLYLTMGAIFIAQATNVPLTFGQELAVLMVCLLTSKGAAAVVGSAFITLTATLSTMKTIPVEGMLLLLGVDWFMAQVRAMTNMFGNGVATIVVARWENVFDASKARRALNGEPEEDPEQVEPAGTRPAQVEAVGEQGG
jgi:aerobic C4-dicarboxylate transport protein